MQGGWGMTLYTLYNYTYYTIYIINKSAIIVHKQSK